MQLLKTVPDAHRPSQAAVAPAPALAALRPLQLIRARRPHGARQWPEESDFVARFCTLHAILAWP